MLARRAAANSSCDGAHAGVTVAVLPHVIVTRAPSTRRPHPWASSPRETLRTLGQNLCDIRGVPQFLLYWEPMPPSLHSGKYLGVARGGFHGRCTHIRSAVA